MSHANGAGRRDPRRERVGESEGRSPSRNARAKRSAPRERSARGEAARERACRGVRGAKPIKKRASEAKRATRTERAWRSSARESVSGSPRGEAHQETRERSEARHANGARVAKQRARERVGESEGRSPSVKQSAPGGIRTPDLRLRRPALYPTELRAHIGRQTRPTSYRGGGSRCKPGECRTISGACPARAGFSRSTGLRRFARRSGAAG